MGGGAASCSAVLCIASSCMTYSTGIFSVVYSQSVYVHRISMLAIMMCFGIASVRNALLSVTDDTTVYARGHQICPEYLLVLPFQVAKIVYLLRSANSFFF